MKDTSHLPSRVLVANRGEIACRIIRTLDRLGIASLAVHHAAERHARHVRMAGRAVEIEGPTPVAAHLDVEQVVAAARATGADAVHPGYGFLSENAAFARAVQDAGLTWIGPRPETIELMGDKIRSRSFAEENGVPVAPSVLHTGDLSAFVEEAGGIGFPVLVKAAAGGGGKGMSIVREPGELAEKAARAASEAERYFADGRIYAERYIERPRHIEVQVFGDGQGGAVHLFERECSVQRRFQKVIEEAPAPALDDALRAEICRAALKLARAARYTNAGTVEFILAPDGAFYFLEMNTRLQVEHPVTEMITGRDLVELQLDIAGGAALPAQEDIVARGHAIEVRLCAENPEMDFLPETGRVLRCRVPESKSVRFDSGLTEGEAVTSDFDPMLAKLIVHGQSREAALAQLGEALEHTVLLGVQTNLDYLSRVVAHPSFAGAALHTGFLDQHAADLREPPLGAEETLAGVIAAALMDPDVRRLIGEVPEPYASMGAWRAAG
jgi:propionyl-CoA carboxylase alpha chain/3-methylcrotonyl-CoA carboxylase alpha subunit/acetyl-CoA/propionyl-CoA carboxylase biotin carboxyl carrier protein